MNDAQADGAGASPDGDDEFRAFYARHLDPVWRFARRRCDSAEDADDVVAETFAVAWRRRADVPSDGAALWLFGVARRVLANHRRTAERRSRLHLRLASTEPAGGSSSDGADAGLEDDNRLAEALGRLDPDDRELLLLRAWDGLAVQDIAALLGCSPNAASLRLHRARGRLTALLDAKGPPTSRTSGGRPVERKQDAP